MRQRSDGRVHGCQAAIDVHGDAGDVGCIAPAQERHRARDLGRLTNALERADPAERVLGEGADEGSLSGVSTQPGATALTRMPSGANSTDMDVVSEMSAAVDAL